MILVILVDGAKAFLGAADGDKYMSTKEIPLERGKRPDLLEEISLLLKPKEISGVIVFSGPGSFTSLRVAVAIANAFSFALDVPVAGVPEIDEPDVLLKKGLEILNSGSKSPVLPFYKKGPNITQPKNK